MKKKLPLIVLAAVIIAVLLGVILFVTKKDKKAIKNEPVIETQAEIPQSLDQRPFVTLTPRSDGHEIALNVANLQNVNSVDYEMVYLVGDSQRGVIGSAETKGQTSFNKIMLLGSCSKNVCKYDEGVTGGSLTLKVRTDQGTVKYELPFLLAQGSTKKQTLDLNNGDFVFEGVLPKGDFYIFSASQGVSKLPSGMVASPAYVISTNSKKLSGTISLKYQTGSQTPKIFGSDFDTKSWEPLLGSKVVTDGLVSASVTSPAVFLAVFE
jgi:hypothetical protein